VSAARARDGRPIRVAYFSGMTMGGAERQMLELARRLPRDRFQVEFVVFGRQGPTAEEAEALGFTVHRLGVARSAGGPRVLAIVRGWRILWRFIRLVRRRRYDIVDGWLFYGYAMAALSRPLSRVPVVVAGRRSLSGFKARHGPVARLADAVADRWSDAIVANSDAVADDVASREGIDRGRITVIRNGVEPASAPDREAVRRLRDAWGAGSPGTVVIGCVAAFRAVKGHDLLLRAFAELGTGPSPRVTLVLIGDGELRDPIERRIAQLGLGGSVILHGEVADARSTYGALDIVVQASSEEGLPNAMLEAAAAGRGIVATAAGGTGEIVRDGLTGLLVPIDDAAALSAAMRRLVEDPILRESLGEGARRHVLATFGMDRMVAEFAALYSGLVARGTR
jgi:glycosyltransferase involved in cell wall biosynthesis